MSKVFTGPISGDMHQKLVELAAHIDGIADLTARVWARSMVRGLFDDIERVAAIEETALLAANTEPQTAQ